MVLCQGVGHTFRAPVAPLVRGTAGDDLIDQPRGLGAEILQLIGLQYVPADDVAVLVEERDLFVGDLPHESMFPPQFGTYLVSTPYSSISVTSMKEALVSTKR